MYHSKSSESVLEVAATVSYEGGKCSPKLIRLDSIFKAKSVSFLFWRLHFNVPVLRWRRSWVPAGQRTEEASRILWVAPAACTTDPGPAVQQSSGPWRQESSEGEAERGSPESRH